MARKRKDTTHKREPNGRVSRRPEDVAKRQLDGVRELKEEERAMLLPGVAARVRILGVPAAEARNQMAGSFIGRLCLRGELTRPQYEALGAYHADCAAYRQAIVAPRIPGAVDLNATHGIAASAADDAEFVAKAKRRYIGDDGKGGVCRAVLDKQCEVGLSANLWAALSLCVIEDKDLPHMVGELRVAANALVRHYKLDRRDAA